MNLQRLYHAIALSVVSSPARINLWNDLDKTDPGELVDRCYSCKLSAQNYIAQEYPSDLMECAKRIYDKVQKGDIKVLDYWDDSYPCLLKEIAKPPIVLYSLGTINDHEKIAIVGTRKTDPQSKIMTRTLSHELAVSGYCVVSGMAIGVDRDAHDAALHAHGTTIGVLANGIDIVYPWANKDIYDSIINASQSCLISEYPPGIRAGKWTFVRRNRIISGLSRATVIVKAAEKSGALITANYAVEQNREVFVCCGHAVDTSYAGCHQLIKNGATLVTETGDIINNLQGHYTVQPVNDKEAVDTETILPVIEEENGKHERTVTREILDMLSVSDFDIDNLIRKCDRSISDINGALLALELSGKIYRDGNRIIKA